MTDPGARADGPGPGSGPGSGAAGEPDTRARSAVYLTDSMADIRMLEGLGRRLDVTLVAPAFLGDRLTNFWPPRPPAKVERVLLAGGRLGFVARSAWWLARAGRHHDVVVVLDNLSAALGANLGRLFGGPPVLVQVGRPTLDYLKCQKGLVSPLKWWLRYAVAWVLVQVNERSAGAIGAVSEYCAAQCRTRNRRVRFVPWYGVDTNEFRPLVSKQEARQRLSLPLDLPIVMLRSRIAPEKDPATWLRAIARLRAEGRTIHALYMGGEIPEITEVAEREGVEIDSRKPADASEIPLWYVAADVDVQTSRAEGLGVSPLESLACGTPIVVSDVGGLPEVVDGGRVGALVPAGDAAATAKAIAAYLDDPELAASAAAAGRAWVEERFTTEQAFTAWVELADLAASTRGGRGQRRARGRRGRRREEGATPS